MKLLFVFFMITWSVFSHAEELSYRDFLGKNAANASKIEIGMTLDQVKTIMGIDTSAVKDGPINNPWKIEVLGKSKIYHYLVRRNPPLTPLLEQQAIPVMLENDKVVAIGREYLREFRTKALSGESASSSSSAPESTGGSVEERLEKLKSVHDKGLITDEEYSQQKQKIIESM